MTVAHDASSASHASGSFSVSQTSFSWTHTPVGTPRGVLVLVFQGVAFGSAVTSVTYGGVNVPQISGAAAFDTATEPGSATVFFLGSGIPTGAQTVVVNRTNNTTTVWAVANTVTAATDTEVTGAVLVQEDGTIAEQSVSDGSPGTNSVRYSGVYYGGATPAPAGTNSTLLFSNDAGAYGWTAVRETTAGQGSRLVGCTQATSDDRAIVAIAVREPPPPAATFDASSSQVGTSVASISWSHTCTGTNLVLFVDVAVGTSAGGDSKTATVTYNGVSMTSLGKRHSNDQTSGFVERFVLVAPTTGTNTVAVNIGTSATSLIGGAISFTTASQSLAVYTETTAAGNGTAVSVTQTAPAATSMVLGGHGAGTNFSAIGQTTCYNVSNSSLTGCGNLCANITPGTGSNVNMTATVSASDWWASLSTEVKVVGTAPPAELPIVTMSPRIPV